MQHFMEGKIYSKILGKQFYALIQYFEFKSGENFYNEFVWTYLTFSLSPLTGTNDDNNEYPKVVAYFRLLIFLIVFESKHY